MATLSKTFRLFVSSTFSDLKAERNALQKEVFPRLQELCASYGTRFQAIDLRWGVSIEAGLDQRTMRLCLQELERCQETTPKPNFLVLLGDRYGWEPLPEEIPDPEFNEILRKVREDPQRFNSLADPAEKDALSLLDKWYWRDKNNEPHLHVLKPRTGEYAVFEVWQRTAEEPLRSILRAAMHDHPLDDDARSRYQFSATHQEIHHGALKVRDARHHVFACYRALTKVRKYADAQVVPEHLHDYVDGAMDDAGTKRFDKPAYDRCNDLKEKLEEAIGQANVHKHEVEVTDNGITTRHIGSLPEKWEDCLAWLDAPLPQEAPLCRQVWHDVGRVIREECRSLQQRDPLQLETEAHARFREERARIFVGRDSLQNEATDALDTPVPYPLVFHGVSGSGKSAFLAAVAARIARKRALADMFYVPLYASPIQRPDGTPIRPKWTGEAILVERFIGATPASTRIRPLLESLCRSVVAAYGAGDFEPAEKFDELVKQFHEHLGLACEKRPLVILLDAVNQLADDEHARLLNWLPTELPPHVTVMLSTTSDDAPCLEAARKRWPPSAIRAVKPLSRDEGKEILEAVLKDAGRTLQDDQQNEVLRQFEANGLPLYLKLAFEEARRWRSWEGVPSYEGHVGLAPDVPGIIGNLFWRLEQPEEHGALLVSRSLGYLAAARHGLTEDELLGVLTLDRKFVQQFTAHPFHPVKGTVPVAVWSRLYHDLEPYLTWRFADGTDLLGFYHGQVKEVATKKYLGDADRKPRHGMLAEYFSNQKNFTQQGTECLPNVRRCAELPHQATHGDRKAILEETLTDIFFIEAKCTAGLTDDLTRDYLAARDRDKDAGSWPGRERVAEFQFFVARDAHILRQYPELTFQRAANSPDNTEPALVAQRLAAQGAFKRPWVRWVNKQREATARLRTLIGHTGAVNGTCFSPDEKHVLTWSGDGTARISDVETGATVHILAGHEKRVYRAEYSPDGTRVVTASDDGTACLWEPESGTRLCRVPHVSLKDFGARRKMRLLPPGGRFFVALATEHEVALHALNTGERQHTLSGHQARISNLVWSPDGRLLATADEDGTVRIWDPASGKLRNVLQGHTKRVTECMFSADGRLLVTSARDGRIAFWALHDGQRVGEFKGWRYDVDNLVLSPQNRFLVFRPAEEHPTFTGSWSGDAFRRASSMSAEETEKAIAKPAHALTFVDLKESSPEKLRGHLAIPSRSRFLPGSEDLLSAAKDGTIRRWNLQSNTSAVMLEGPLNTNWKFQLAHDQRRILAVGGDEWAEVDVESGRTLARVEASGCDRLEPILSTDGRLLVTSAPGNGVTIWDVPAAREASAAASPADTVREVKAIAADGDTVAHQVTHETWALHGLNRHEEFATVEHASGAFTGSALSPNGKLLAHTPGKKLAIDQVTTGARLYELDVTAGLISALAFSPSGETLAALDSAGVVTLWDVETGLLLGSKGEVGKVGREPGSTVGPVQFQLAERGHLLGFSRDGESLYVGSGGNALTVLDVPTGREKGRVAELGGRRADAQPMVIQHQDGRSVPQEVPFEHVLTAFDVSPDGAILATIHQKGILTLWDRASGQQLRQNTYCEPAARALAWSADSRYLALAFADRTIRLIEATTLEEVATKLEAPAELLRFRAGGHELVTGPEFFHLEWHGVEFGRPLGSPAAEKRTPLVGRTLEAAQSRTNDFKRRLEAKRNSQEEVSKAVEEMQALERQCKKSYAAGNRDETLALATRLEQVALQADHLSALQTAYETQAIVLAQLGRQDEALQKLQEQEAICTRIDAWESLRSCFSNQGLCLKEVGQLDAALQVIRRAENLCLKRGKKDDLLQFLGQRASLLDEMGRPDEAIDSLRERERVAVELHNQETIRDCRYHIARILTNLRELDQAHDMLADLLRTARERGKPWEQSRVLELCGAVADRRSAPDRALDWFKQQETLCRQAGLRKQLQECLENQKKVRRKVAGGSPPPPQHPDIMALAQRANSLQQKGDLDGALAGFARLEARCRELGDDVVLEQSLRVQADLYIKRKQLPEAGVKLEEAATMLRKTGDEKNLARTLGNLGVIYANTGRVDEALLLFVEQEQLLRPQGPEDQLANCLFNQAVFLQKKAQVDEGLRCAKEANALYTKLGNEAGRKNVAGLLGALQMMKRHPGTVRVARKKRDDE